MIKIIVHRGTDAIGGTCIEVIADTGRLILDLGKPLMANGGGDIDPQLIAHPSIENGILSNVSGLFDGKFEKPILGVLLSHAHPDHYGLLDSVHSSIPVYMSGESKAMIEVGNIFYPPEMRLPDAINRCHIFKQNKSFTLGDFTITPYLIDHAAFGASSFQIDVEGKRILYTGDLRAHGRKRKTFDQLPNNVGHVDCMLMEGTTLGGKHHVGFDSEDAVEAGFVESFSHDNATFVLAAGGNVDRIVSLYRACKRTGKIMVIDLYQFYLLTKIKQFAPGLPPHKGDHLRVFFERNQEKRLQEKSELGALNDAKPRQIFPGQIIQQAPRMVLRLSCSMMDRLATKMDKKEDMKFIYSMWQGYLDKGEKGKNMADIPRKHEAEWEHVHTSGHAWLEDLQNLSAAIKPDKLIPIHTLQGDDFAEHFDSVVRIKDGEEVNL